MSDPVPDEWGYARVNGTRINVEKYHRKIRKLERQVGRQVCVTSGDRGPPSMKRVVHQATLVLCEPRGRQVYPRLAYNLKCGLRALGMGECWHIVTCKRCNK